MEPADDMAELMSKVDWIPVFGPWPADYGIFATHMDWLMLGGYELQVYTLNDGQHVFDADSVAEAFGDA